MLQLVMGSPEDINERIAKEQRCYRFLDAHKLTYWRCDHPNMIANTMEDCKEVAQILNAQVCKNIFLCNRKATDFYLLMMPGDKNFRSKQLSPQLGCSRLSFAMPGHMEELLDITPGSLSVLGLINDKDQRVQLLVDRDLLEGEFIGCHPCINTSSLKLYTKDLFHIILPALKHEPIFVTLHDE